MKNILALVLALCWMVQLGRAQDAVPPAIRIFAQDVVQGSVQQLALKTNGFTNAFLVRWNYTEAGAKKMLAYWEANQGKTSYTQIGNFTSAKMLIQFRPLPPYITNFAQWKMAWLEGKTGKMICRTPGEVLEVTAGLKAR